MENSILSLKPVMENGQTSKVIDKNNAVCYHLLNCCYSFTFKDFSFLPYEDKKILLET